MSIWFKPASPADFRGKYPNTLLSQLGIEITEIGDDFVRGTMPVDHRTHQVFGLLHGGASVAFAETLGGIGSMLTLDGDKQITVGQEINANHLRGVSATGGSDRHRPPHPYGRQQPSLGNRNPRSRKPYGLHLPPDRRHSAKKTLISARIFRSYRPRPTHI